MQSTIRESLRGKAGRIPKATRLNRECWRAGAFRSTSCLRAWFDFNCARLRSPLDRALFRSVDLRQFVGAVEKPLHVIHQKPLRFRIGEIKTVVIDDARLGLQPFRPTGLADFGGDFLAEFSRKRSKAKRRAFLPTAGTFDFVRHVMVSPCREA